MLGTSHEEQESVRVEKLVLASRVTGTVKWFNVKRGFGFIARDDVQEDVFVHRTAIARNDARKRVASVGRGETVEFHVVESEKGYRAANVTGPNGKPLVGSKHARYCRRRRNADSGRPSVRRPYRCYAAGDSENSYSRLRFNQK